MKKITFIGAPSSGKSTLTTQVYSTLKRRNINAEMVNEWVRQDIWANGAMQSIWEQYRTMVHHKEIEDMVPKTVDILVSDSCTLTPYFYAVHYLNPNNTRERLVLQDMYRYLLDDIYLQRYDLIFYLPVDPSVNMDDGTRFQTKDDVSKLDEHMKMIFTKLHKTNAIHAIEGPLDTRLAQVINIIDEKLIKKEVASSVHSLL